MANNENIDKLYANPLSEVGQFCFDQQVVQVFPDMIKRSVPGYASILSMIGDIAERYAQPNSLCYDLGCSLGAASLAMQQRIQAAHCHIIGIDNSIAMIERCQMIVNALETERHSCNLAPIQLICSDIESIVIERASIVVLNFTLQFLPLERRQAMIRRIYDGLLPGGILVLSEKVLFEDSSYQQRMTELYYNFKRANGYSDLEIAQKRTALETVLQPQTIQSHTQAIKQAGFRSVDVWFQCFTFASMLAIKS